jgi:1-acyl-sn-glycerol-3-phosphate acyltransferase
MDFSIRFRKSLTFVVHKPLAVSEYDFADLIEKTEAAVVQGIKI